MQVAVLGYGTVGSGVVEVLQNNKEDIGIKAKELIDVKYILDIKTFEGHPLQNKFTKDFDKILQDPQVQVIAETMGGIEPAYTYTKQALNKGKSVVTSNKELVAAHAPELIELAATNKCNFLFEASVGGGIPVIRPLNSALTADTVEEITGILNGTTNYILTKMEQEGSEFEEVLKEAQDLGYAERNPEADVEGHDACRKIAILSSLAFGRHIDYKDVATQGITKITKQDMEYAKAMGHTIKLLGVCKRNDDDEVSAYVAPMLIDKSYALAGVSDVFNAVLIKGNMVGDVMFYGQGAGKLPTASAVVGDIVDAVRHPQTHVTTFWDREKISLKSLKEVEASYFIRAKGNVDLIKEMVQHTFDGAEEIKALYEEEYVFVTAPEKESNVKEKLEQLSEHVQLVSQIKVRR